MESIRFALKVMGTYFLFVLPKASPVPNSTTLFGRLAACQEHIPTLGDTQTGRCSAAIVRECALGRFYLRGWAQATVTPSLHVVAC